MFYEFSSAWVVTTKFNVDLSFYVSFNLTPRSLVKTVKTGLMYA